MRWALSWRFDPRAVRLADRHYNRQNPGTPQFVAPGRPLVLLTPAGDALWVSLQQAHQDHAWRGAWVNVLFRNEAPERYLSSELITEALAATVAAWGPPPPQGMVTFIDERKVRRKRDAGRCYRKVGFVPVGRTSERDLLALQLAPEKFPAPRVAIGSQSNLFNEGRG